MIRQSSRAPAWFHDLPVMNDAPLDVGGRAFVFFHQRSRQHEVGIAGGLGHEEVDHGEEFQPTECFADEVAVRQRHGGVEADQKEALDAAVVDRFEQWHRGQAGMRDGRLLDAPHVGDVLAVGRTLDIASAWQLIAFLALFAGALTVALPGDHRVAAAFPPDAA